MTASGAPTTVMKGSAAIRLEYFRSFTMAHPLLKEVDLALREAIQEPAGASLIFVYGPTGVGKTTLRTPVENQLKESLIPLLQQDPGRASVVSIEAAAPDSAQFSWKDYYKRALMALEEPLIGKKIKYSIRGLDRDISGRLIVDGRTVGLELRHAVENTLAHRRPAAFFVDEAQHLTKVRGGRKLHDQLDSIKSLASLTGTAHVLIGTYELLPFRNLSAQLSRRSIDVHFRRYRAENQEDYSSFRSVLFTFQRHLPLSGDSELLKHVDFCYERSVGCVGVLKNWLIRALSVALLNNSPSITTQILERTAWSVEQSERMAREALEGEASLATTDESRNRLRRLLSLNLAMPSAVSPSNRNPPIANRRPGWEDANQCVIVSGFPRECAMQLDQQEKEFESWDLSEPAVPPRSKCFHLQPMGFGTGYVECLTSYFSRLAVEHSVSAGALTHRIMIPRNAGKRNMFSCAVSCRVSRLRCPTSGINSLGSMAARFASVVEELTGRSDLHYLTMLTWRELLPPQLLTRGMGAWCPHCINEWRETGRSVYIPLLWTLEIVKHCPLHQSPLQLMCPHCKAPQPFIAQLSPNGFCARCKRWLGKAVRESGLDQFSVLRPESSDWEI